MALPLSFVYRLLFMLELYAAEYLFIFRLKRKKYFYLRGLLCALFGLLIAAVIPISYNAVISSLTFLFLFAITVCLLWFCLDEPWINLIFCGVAGYTLQHFSYGIANFLMTCVSWGRSPLPDMYGDADLNFSTFDLWTVLMILLYLLAYFVSYWLLFLRFGNRIKKGQPLLIKRRSVFVFVAVGFVVDIILNSIVIYYGGEQSVLNSILNTVYESLCCFFLLTVQFNLIRERKLESELEFVQHLLREKERQYELTKESVNLINLKCHDLKHQIREIGAGKRLPDETVREIENVISVYDANVRTGNEVLDIILTEKSLKCAHNQIKLSCIADGKQLDFLADADAYSLFGNALDNAIEAVMKLKDEEKRVIGVVVRNVGDLVSINVNNYYDGELDFSAEGLPKTTKGDRDFHGFGVKSIWFITEKYGGSMSIAAHGNTFNLNILFPAGTKK